MVLAIQQPLEPSQSDALQSEAKFVAPLHRADFALQVLRKFCSQDGEYPASIVSSIYFDTRSWDFLGEKRNSDYLKAKVRLRWYADADGGQLAEDGSYIEAKYRVGSKRMKFRELTHLTGAHLTNISLEDPELRQIADRIVSEGAPIPQPIFPAFVVRYRRHRFVDRVSGTRISLDSDITSPKTNPFMLANARPCRLSVSVLEVKSSGDTRPRFLTSLLRLGFRKHAFSKYYECYGCLTGAHF